MMSEYEEMIKAKEDFKREAAKFFQEFFPLSKKGGIEYKTGKDQIIARLETMIITKKNLQEWFEVRREEIGEILKKAIDEASETLSKK